MGNARHARLPSNLIWISEDVGRRTSRSFLLFRAIYERAMKSFAPIIPRSLKQQLPRNAWPSKVLLARSSQLLYARLHEIAWDGT